MTTPFGPRDWMAIATNHGLRMKGRLARVGLAIDHEDLVGELILAMTIGRPANQRDAQRIANVRGVDWLRSNVARRDPDGNLRWRTDVSIDAEEVSNVDDGDVPVDARVVSRDNVARALRFLNLREHVVMTLLAAGFEGREVAAWLDLDPAAVTRASQTARDKLSQFWDAA